jgi:hypothetical protein
MSSTRSIGMFGVLLFLPPVLPLIQAPPPTPPPSASGKNLRINSAVRIQTAPGVEAYSIDYNYDFPGKDSVHVAGLGLVPGRGHFHYVTSATQLEIYDAHDGTPIVTRELQETTVVAAKPPLNEIPPPTAFETSHKSYVWKSNRSLPQHLDDVLNAYFRYEPREDQKASTITTSFTPLALPDSSNGTLAQVALLISFPHESTPGEFRFYVQTDLQEGRSHSDDFRPTNDPQIVAACDKFLVKLFSGIATTGGEQK